MGDVMFIILYVEKISGSGARFIVRIDGLKFNTFIPVTLEKSQHTMAHTGREKLYRVD
jgi:hypothetical protein